MATTSTGNTGSGERIGMYAFPDDALAAGSTIGGPKACMVIKATGAMEQLYSIDAGETLFGTLLVHHWDADSGAELDGLRGEFVIRPDRQERHFRLINGVDVSETLFVFNPEPDASDADLPAAYYVVDLHNSSSEAVRMATFGFAQLRGSMPHDVVVEYDAGRAAFVAWNSGKSPDHVRVFGTSRPPEAYAATSDHAMAIAGSCPGPLSNTTSDAGSDPLGVFHHRHDLGPGESARIWYTLTFSTGGRTAAERSYDEAPDAATALRRTAAHYTRVLERAVVVTPDAEVNRGVLWAKANMLRTELHAPTGWSFVNDPTRSNNSVGRDTAWFAFGADYMTPEFARDSLLAYVERQEPSGMIVEYYDVRTGKTADYGLNVNDNTPLLILALWHHYNTTGDRAFLERVYQPALKAARFLLGQRDERGLVWCTSTKTQDWGIVGWRNVIDNYRLSGATTELNSECYAALATAGHMARELGDGAIADEFAEHAQTLRTAINTHLRNPANGLYYLNIDVDGQPRTDITSDLVFPVMFGVADDDTAARIVSRLSTQDFWTSAGIRTVPRDSTQYGPTHGYGLLGGVWVGVSFWFAFAAAKFSAGVMAEALSSSFRHYSRDPGKNNTVPGQFSEWLHGETLVNQGMMLSPWFPPRYLWAAIEGAGGLSFSGPQPALTPRLAPEWKWLGVSNVPFRGTSLTWFAARAPEVTLYANLDLDGTPDIVRYASDISNRVRTDGHSSIALGLEGDGNVMLLAGNTTDRAVTTALRLDQAPRGEYRLRTFNSLRGAWIDGGTVQRDDLQRGMPLELERKGFALLELTAA